MKLMRQSHLFTKTLKNDPKDEQSVNARLLERGGFIYKNSAGVYSYLPLGWRVMQKIVAIVREEMNAIGGQEMLMPALVERKYLAPTGRWNVDVGYKVHSEQKAEKMEDQEEQDVAASFVLGWTHEEVLAEIATKYLHSYKDLPFAAYQIQTKFRNEPRAKSGILRGREFMMKDLYSFHATADDLFRYYEEVHQAYEKIFRRCGLDTIYVEAAGGTFTVSNTHEFQVEAEVGEDTIFVCAQCGHAENSEISEMKEGQMCKRCGGVIVKKKGIEVGNIFPLGTKYSHALDLTFINEKGEKEDVIMGSYGIGIGRTMGTVVEVHHDDKGIIWPKTISPYSVHLVLLDGNDEGIRAYAEDIYAKLIEENIEVLYDDRHDSTAGEKFADADLLGIPWRVVVSKRSVEKGGVEVKARTSAEARIMPAHGFVSILQ